jgi:membrane protease YdiL (CAAX protease family)
MAQSRPQSDGFPMAVLVEGGLALAAACLGWLFSVPLRDLFPEWGQPLAAAAARGILFTLPMFVLFWAMIHSQLPTFRHLRDQVKSLIREMFPTGSYAQFAMVALLAGVGEELLFRGVIQTKLVEWTNPVAGLVLASLVFGAAHALSKLYFLLATLIGLYLGWLLQRYDELITPMIAHALYDFLALVYLFKSGARGRRNLRPADEQPSDEDRRPNSG